MEDEIAAYLLVKECEGLAKSTLYEYRLYLTAFNAYVHSKPLDKITNADIAGWIVSERNEGYKDSSILARQRALRIFFNWCVEYDYLTKSPLRMKNPKVKDAVTRVASLAAIQKVLQFPPDTWTDYRNIALVYLLLDTGMRIGEAVGLALTNINLDSRLVSIPPGKNGEGRVVPFTVGCAEAIDRYLFIRPRSPWGKWLFNSSLHGNARNRLSTGGARALLYKFYARIGVGPINPHSIRHLFATKALNDGLRVEIVSRILGHSSVDLTLKVYANLMTDTIQREYDNLWKILR